MQLFSVLPTNVFAAFSRLKIEESWPCGRVPRFSVFHNTDAERANSFEKKRNFAFLGRGPIRRKRSVSQLEITTGQKYGNRSYRRSFQEMR